MERCNVLIVELERSSAQVAEPLRRLGYGVESARDPAGALERLRGNAIDLVVLGAARSQTRLSLCAAIRARCEPLPILLIGADAREREALGRRSGPDDYVVRELDPDEIHARARTLLRRSARDHAARVPIECGPLRLDAETYRVAFLGREAHLTATEYELLRHLARAPERVFSRAELLRAVWGHRRDGYAHTLTSHVNRLRAKLERTLGAPRVIETVHGLGYRFVPPEPPRDPTN